MIAYLDASVVLRVVLRQGRPAADWGRWEQAYSSELLGLEARRVIDRLRLEGALDDDALVELHQELGRVEEAIGFVALTRTVLQRAGLPMATAVKTLDAIHLASALMLQEHLGHRIVLVTHDGQQAKAARAMGIEVRGD